MSLFQLLLRIPVPWVFVLTYLAGVTMERMWPLGGGGDARVGIAGGIVFVIGAVVAGWGLVLFHRERTTTVPGRASSRLVTWGPYAFSRNPMYVGLVLAYVGEAGLLRQVWPLALLPLTVAYINGIVIPLEEARLREAFQEEYERYRTRVRRWL
jgi:protein-S-isoprenylcysteine O-methyltransferase Ste14